MKKAKEKTQRLAFFTRDLSPEESAALQDFLLLLTSTRKSLPRSVLSPDVFSLMWYLDRTEPADLAALTANPGETNGP